MTELSHNRRPSSAPSRSTGVETAFGEGAIWGRLIQPERDDLTADAARSFLRMGFDEWDKARMHELALKNQEGALTAWEQAEIEDYCRVGRLLDLLHSKARRSLKRLESSP